MYPSGASEPTVVCKEPLFVDERWFLMNSFIQEAPIGKRMVVKFYNYANTMRTCTNTMRTAKDTLRIPLDAA